MRSATVRRVDWYDSSISENTTVRAQPLSTPSDEILSTSDLPPWYHGALLSIFDLLDLQSNWDTYGAAPIKVENAVTAIQILEMCAPKTPQPSIVPTVRGGVQIEWHTKGIDLEFEIISPTTIEVLFVDLINGKEFEDKFEYDWRQLGDFIQLISTR